ncbi:MAG: acyltransferase family protein [Thermodesulfobacteriota bacterium]|nr:acyltransferase family protein [Thermodesulfobacteriota bacterium]
MARPVLQHTKSGLPYPERVAYIGIAKGLLIVFVVFGHAWQAVFNNNILHDANIYHMVNGWIYSFHMPAFFFISGIFAMQSAQRSIGNFILRKLQTIAYPFVLWSVLQLLLQLLVAESTTNTMTMVDFLKIPIEPIMQFWFLYALFFIFLFFVVLKQITSSRTICLGVGILLFIVLQLGHGTGCLVFIYLAGNFIYFSAGIFCSEFLVFYIMKNWPGSHRLFFFALLLFLVSIIIQPGSSKLSPEIYSWMQPLVAMLGIGFVLLASLFLFSISKTISSIFMFLGNRSLEIFVAHIIFSAGFRIAAIQIAEVNSVSVHLLGATAAGLAGPVLLVSLANRFGLRYMFTWPANVI